MPIGKKHVRPKKGEAKSRVFERNTKRGCNEKKQVGLTKTTKKVNTGLYSRSPLKPGAIGR